MGKNEQLDADEVKELVSEINHELFTFIDRDDICLVNEFEDKGIIFFAGVPIFNEERDTEITGIYKLSKHIKKEIKSIRQLIYKIKL